MTRAFGVRWRGEDDVLRKMAFEPADGGLVRVTYRWNGCRWLPEGRESVSDVGLEAQMPMMNSDRGP